MSYCVITGASSGIGMEFAKRLDKEYDLILVARRKERLEELKKELSGNITILPCDLSNEEDINKLYENIKDLDVKLFINNAGFGETGSFLTTDYNKEKQMLDVNVKAVYMLTKLMTLKMESRGGTILNVASVAGLLPGGPYMSQYYATKAYVASLTRGIARELKEKKSKLYVCALCPGPVDTEFNMVANSEFSLKGITVEKCVNYCLKKMKKKKTIIVPGFGPRFASAFGIRFVSANTTIKLTAKQQKKKIYR